MKYRALIFFFLAITFLPAPLLYAHGVSDENEYRTIQEKIMKNRAPLDDVVQFQQLLDSRVKSLIASSPEDLFNVERGRPMQQTNEMPTIYLSC